jgi:hypothetical protein
MLRCLPGRRRRRPWRCRTPGPRPPAPRSAPVCYVHLGWQAALITGDGAGQGRGRGRDRCGCGCWCVCERETERDRETETERQRETDCPLSLTLNPTTRARPSSFPVHVCTYASENPPPLPFTPPHSLTHPLTHSLTHSLTHPLTHLTFLSMGGSAPKRKFSTRNSSTYPGRGPCSPSFCVVLYCVVSGCAYERWVGFKRLAW